MMKFIHRFFHKEEPLVEEPRRVDARAVVEQVLSQPLPTIDPTTLKKNEYDAYCADALGVINSPAFRNEMNLLIKEFQNEITNRAENYDRVLDLRMSINSLKLLRENLEALAERPKQRTKSTDPYSGV